MPIMDMTIEVCFGSDAADEVELSVDFSFAPGSPAHMGSLSYPGHPAETAEIEIQTIFWPYMRYDREKIAHVPDHIEMPYSGLPLSVMEAIETRILEEYIPEDDYDDR